MNVENPDGNEINITRVEWLKGAGIAVGTMGLNHWFWTDSGRFFPIVVWGAPLFGLVCLAGVIYPKLTDHPLVMILIAFIGLALGLFIHHRVYGF